MRKNRKNDSHTRRKRICIAALLLAGSLIPGGCGIKKEKTSDTSGSEREEDCSSGDYKSRRSLSS